MFICSSYCLLCMFSVSDSSIYIIYWRSFNFPYVTCTCMFGPHHLIMYTCASYARHLALLYVLAGLRLTTLNSHVQILETGPWWPCCSWSEYAADPCDDRSAAKAWSIVAALSPSSSPVWFSRPLLLLVSTSQLLYISSYDALLYFWWCNHVLILFYWNVYDHCASALWFLPVLMLSVYTWGYLWPAYIRLSGVFVPARSGRHNYTNKISCDAITMSEGQVILGKSWLFDKNITICGWSNMCQFEH